MILDTSALVAILFGESEADAFTQSIHDADRCLISAGSFVELSIVLDRLAAPEASRQCEMFLRRAGIAIEPITVEQAHIARQAFHDFGKGRHAAGLNFGDCFAYALSKVSGEPLLYKGEDFRQTGYRSGGMTRRTGGCCVSVRNELPSAYGHGRHNGQAFGRGAAAPPGSGS